jgi:putative transcriptional regulator
LSGLVDSHQPSGRDQEVTHQLAAGFVALENRVKHYREAQGWSQGELARRLGVSRQTINAVETDKYDPSLPLALRMARLFGVGVPELFIDQWEPEA